ncbi:USG-1 protein [BD1-7 clade bacterium]|uniref:USG-1 protein n=1 Tax=BD1-7 clade bacterium TaxID=2029982 RepID=A0A5S9PT27_9GAMM|nr:USG-1 protein [BD1-7 clade bacterium]
MSQPKIAVVCQEGLPLDAFLDGLSESALVDAQVNLVGVTHEAASSSAMFNGRPLAFGMIDDVDFSDADLIVVLESSLVVEASAAKLKAVSCPVLGFERDLESLGPQSFDVAGVGSAKVIGLQQPAVLALKLLLPDSQLEGVDVTAFYPVSLFGKAGVNELAAQTARLLNVQPLEHQLFETQMPFNYFPLSAMDQMAELEAHTARELSAAFDTDDVHVKAFQMPVFHGQGLAVSVIMTDEVDLDVLIEAFESNPVVDYRASNKQLSNYEVVQQPGKLMVGDLRKSAVDPHRLDLWLGFDENQFAIGQTLISVAELLLKHYL